MSMFDDGFGCVGELLYAAFRGFFRVLLSPLVWLLDLFLDLLTWGGSSSGPSRRQKRKDSAKK